LPRLDFLSPFPISVHLVNFLQPVRVRSKVNKILYFY
jgi:hypothetical protein